MNWINALTLKKANSDGSMSDNSNDHISRSPLEAAQLDRLREVLALRFWHFGPGSPSFDGFSQGICFLGGIYPDGSHASPEYSPRFMPNALASYGFRDRFSSAHAEELRESVTECLNYLRGLKLEGLVPVKDAITAASKVNIGMPWLQIAASDIECARFLPLELRSDDEVREKIKHQSAASGGRARAAKNVQTQQINTKARSEFEKLRKAKYSKDLRTVKGKPVATKIADKIYHIMSEDGSSESDNPPSVSTIASHVREWLKKNSSAEK